MPALPATTSASGRIVAAASRSRFWKEMAIFVIEDDAQNGPDHVDAHRTVGLVISPYCKRGVVDSTLYTTASMVRTMELILGLPPLTQYDAGATPMFNCFTKTAEVTPYQPLTPKVDLLAKNTAKSPGAKQSARMNFREYDLAPEDELNRILWRAAKGEDVPYPTPIHRVHLHRLAPDNRWRRVTADGVFAPARPVAAAIAIEGRQSHPNPWRKPRLRPERREPSPIYQPSTLKTINCPSPRVTAPLTKPKKGSAIQSIITAQMNPALEI